MNPEDEEAALAPSIFLSPLRPSARSTMVGGALTPAAMTSPAPSRGPPPLASLKSPWRNPAKIADAKRDVAARVARVDDVPPPWSVGTIASVDPACEAGTSVLVRVGVPPSLHQQYQIPGQYVKLRPHDGLEGEFKPPLFLAMSSPPPVGGGAGSNDNDNSDDDGPVFEFLVKRTSANAWLTSSPSPFAAVQVSGVLGLGFPVAENLACAENVGGDDDDDFCHPAPQCLLLFAAGSGIGPIKAAIESGLLDVGSDGSKARLYYGERTEADLCFADQFRVWEAMGYEVVPVLSQPTDPASWTGRVGHVQDVLEEDGLDLPHRSGALVVGMKEMADAVKASLVSAGVDDKRVLFNY
jgi:Oxidoreductase NAD-binding domain